MTIRKQRKNINKHTPQGTKELDASIDRDGLIGAITAAADAEVFDGSDRTRKLESVLEREPLVIDAIPGQPVIIRNDGTSPIVNQRIDIPNADDPRAVRLGFAANQIASMNWNPDADRLRAALENDPISKAIAETRDELRELLTPFNPDAVQFKEYDESVADEVKTVVCPNCGHSVPV